MDLKISKDGEKYRILDGDGHVYGTYDTPEKAETNKALWLEYFDAPLVF
jgi:hypothetical protein